MKFTEWLENNLMIFDEIISREEWGMNKKTKEKSDLRAKVLYGRSLDEIKRAKEMGEEIKKEPFAFEQKEWMKVFNQHLRPLFTKMNAKFNRENRFRRTIVIPFKKNFGLDKKQIKESNKDVFLKRLLQERGYETDDNLWRVDLVRNKKESKDYPVLNVVNSILTEIKENYQNKDNEKDIKEKQLKILIEDAKEKKIITNDGLSKEEDKKEAVKKFIEERKELETSIKNLNTELEKMRKDEQTVAEYITFLEERRSDEVLIFTLGLREIASQSTGTPWQSCMTLFKGINKQYVPSGMKAGNFIVFLAKAADVRVALSDGTVPKEEIARIKKILLDRINKIRAVIEKNKTNDPKKIQQINRINAKLKDKIKATVEQIRNLKKRKASERNVVTFKREIARVLVKPYYLKKDSGEIDTNQVFWFVDLVYPRGGRPDFRRAVTEIMHHFNFKTVEKKGIAKGKYVIAPGVYPDDLQEFIVDEVFEYAHKGKYADLADKDANFIQKLFERYPQVVIKNWNFEKDVFPNVKLETLDLSNTDIRKLPKGIMAKNWDLSNTNITVFELTPPEEIEKLRKQQQLRREQKGN